MRVCHGCASSILGALPAGESGRRAVDEQSSGTVK
jgi:hypothetical protein